MLCGVHMLFKVWKYFSILLFCIVYLQSDALYAQGSAYIGEVRTSQAKEHEPLSVSIRLTQGAQVQKAQLFVRGFGESEFQELEMLLSGRVAVATIPSKLVIAPFIEYYIMIQMPDKEAFYPAENPEGNPLRITVEAVDPKDAEIKMLSPEQGETIAAEDLVVAVSLLYTSDAVGTKSTRLYLDGIDVTSSVIISDDVLLFNPTATGKQLELGAHSITVQLFDTTGQPYYTKSTSFNLSTATALEERERSFQYNGSAQLEVRNEYIDENSTTYIRGDIQANGSAKLYSGSLDLHLTNEDKSTLQPQNRYLASFQASKYAKVQLGDAYPVFPLLFVSGKRVRGVSGSLTLGFFNLDMSWGHTERKIEGRVIGDTTYVDSSTAASRPKESLPINGLTYRLFEPGTFTRSFLAVRPSFGSGEKFQIGFNFVKSKDDINSIRYGVYPHENIVAGTDFVVAFDNQRVRWSTQVAMSLLNNDITSGNLSDAAIDSISGVYDTTKTPSELEDAKKDADDLKKIASVGRSIITINEYLSPLDPINHLPSTAVESELSLNYFNNFVRLFVFRRGIAYVSFGNDFVQTDVEGINLSDRIRLFKNKLLLSIAYEMKSNNTLHDESVPTTDFNTLSTSATVFPGRRLPSFTLGYGFYTRENDVDLSNFYRQNKPLLRESRLPSDSATAALYRSLYVFAPDDKMLSTADEITNRYYIGMNYDFSFYGRQTFTVTASIAQKTDKTFYHRDQDNLNISASLTSLYKIPLQTTIGLVISQNTSYLAQQDSVGAYLPTKIEIPFNYQSLTLSARYRLFENTLNIIGTYSPSFGNFRRTLIQCGAEYEPIEHHFVTAEFSFLHYPGRPTDIVAGIIYRFLF